MQGCSFSTDYFLRSPIFAQRWPIQNSIFAWGRSFDAPQMAPCRKKRPKLRSFMQGVLDTRILSSSADSRRQGPGDPELRGKGWQDKRVKRRSSCIVVLILVPSVADALHPSKYTIPLRLEPPPSSFSTTGRRVVDGMLREFPFSML